MFDAIRNKSRILMGVLVLLIIPSFVLFGVEGYNNRDARGVVVAQIGDVEITQQQWDAMHQQEVDKIRASMPNLDPKMLGSDEARYASLERMVNDRMIAVASEKQLLVTSDQRLANYLQQDPSIARLRGPDGKLDMDRYRQLASSQGMTPEMLEAQVRRDLSGQQVLAALQTSAMSSQKQSDVALQAFFQRREVQMLGFSPANYVAKVKLNDADLEKFYQSHSDRFRSQETADVEYLVLDAAALAKNIQLPEQDVKTYYEQNVQRLSGQEQRRASHILINASKDAPAADKDKARAKAESLLVNLRKDPKAFADLARKNSDDTGSASNGGDLDFFAKGAMVKVFEDAAFALKKGEISAVVESEFGFHIIQLTDIKAPVTPGLESMRSQLEADLRQQQAKRQFAEFAETFSNSVYEQADTFTSVADKLRLPIQQAKGLTRAPMAGQQGVLANPKLLEAVFSDESVSKRRNSAAIELGNNTLVSARVVNHRPAALQPYAEVKDQVRAEFLTEQAIALAKAEGEARLAEWQKNPTAAAMGSALTISRDQTQGQAQKFVDAVLRADPANLPALVGVDLGAMGYVLARVNKIVPRDEPSAQQKAQTREQFARLLASAEAAAYMAHLRSQFKVKILVPKPKLPTAS
ncbi:SurA N-terminal domain-containing protein [Limnohabitans sp. Rim28]|uniref:SurA N-terminal domain-containing protein n=1 Tax=Limnohabitans sp. Rim28 TaxID=1100720 RepID=UPI0003123559|nr:SurA N-terminal domain-containing protein [Limnohabitans sp. Rim28]PVE05990.1 peptidylprolyl isomerase [Limnohabitans sp. Rim28]